MNNVALVMNTSETMNSRRWEIIKIYISHTVGCSGWDLPDIYKNTLFNIGCRTMRFREKDKGKVKMLDWDYKSFLKRPEKIKDRHLELTKQENFQVVMSMDYWKNNRKECLEYTNELKKYCDRVLIPIHYYHPELLDYDLAYPNANWFADNKPIPGDYKSKISHILGGSPQKQLRFLKDLEYTNIESIDGNQLFNVAIKHGRYWSTLGDHWYKPSNMTNEEIFRKSIKNFDIAVKNICNIPGDNKNSIVKFFN